MHRTLVFDMGGVLVRFSHHRMVRQLADLSDRDAVEVQAGLISSGCLWDYERGEISPDDFERTLRDLLGTDCSQDQLVKNFADIFDVQPGMPELLDELKSLGLRLVLLSNTSLWHFEWIRDQFDILDRFDAFTLSYEAGAIKPSPVIYQAAERTFDCDPSEVFYTDDVADYVAAARSRDWRAERFETAEICRNHLRNFGIPLTSGQSSAGANENQPPSDG